MTAFALNIIMPFISFIAHVDSAATSLEDSNINRSTQQRMFYIYPWPKYMGDVYPISDAVLDRETVYEHAFNENSGAGQHLNQEIGLFQTWQFSLFKNIMSRLVASKYRTRDPSKATAFIIPFDAGVHSYIDHQNGRRRLASPHGWTAIKYLKDITNSSSWNHLGHDHFVLFSLTEFVMTGIAVKEFFMGICQNCTVLTIESTPTCTSTLYHRTRKYWISVPYPSAFHFHENIITLPWSITPHRDILSFFIGSTFTQNVDSNAFRKVLKSQCDLFEGRSCHWYDVQHSCNAVINSTEKMVLYRRAKFCPAPPGDTITRKSLFDALVSGCVPVIFAKASLSQYFWFLTKDEIASVSVYISVGNVLKQKKNYLEILESISPETLLQKQLAIAKIAPRLQYSLVPTEIRNKINISVRGSGLVQTYGDDPIVAWDPPFEDAVDVIISRVLNRSTIEPIQGFSNSELRMQKCLQHEIILHHPDYAGLFRGGTRHLAAPKLYKKLRCKNITIPKSIFDLASS